MRKIYLIGPLLLKLSYLGSLAQQNFTHQPLKDFSIMLLDQ